MGERFLALSSRYLISTRGNSWTRMGSLNPNKEREFVVGTGEVAGLRSAYLAAS